MNTIFKKVILLQSICCFYFSVSAQKTDIYLKSKTNQLPIVGATLTSVNGKLSLLSDEIGKLAVTDKGEYTITAIGYRTIIFATDTIQANTTIFLEDNITQLKDVQLKATSATGIFYTISDFDIHIRPIINSQEVLRVVPGLFIGQHAGGGKAEQIFLRGFDIDHGTDINITVDGMPVNMVSHAHGQGYADLHFVIPELIDKVNFEKGPYHTSKGNFTTAGYVELKTKNNLDKNFIKLEGGQFGTVRAVAGINLLGKKAIAKNQGLYLANEYSYTKGFFESPQNFDRYNGLLKYHGKISEKSVLTSSISAFTSKWNASGQIPDRAVDAGLIGWYGAIDDNEGGKTSRYNFNTVLTTSINNNTRWKNQVYYSRYNFELFSNFTFFLNNPIDGDQIKQKEARNIYGLNSEIENNHFVLNKQATFKAGIQVRNDATTNNELSNTKMRTKVLSNIALGDIYETNLSAFAEEKIYLTNKLNIVAGLRLDFFENKYVNQLDNTSLQSNSTILSPKLNINYSVNNKVQLYWHNGKGFHSNDTRVAVLQNGREVVTPANGSDIGGIFKLGNKAILQTAFWYLWLQQEFVYVGDAGVVEAGGQTQRMGWDASLRYQLAKALYADFDVNVAYPKALQVPNEESNIPLAPRFTSTGGLSYRNKSAWNGSLRYRYMGNRPANENNSVVAKGYFIADASINYTKPKWEIGLSVQNIFNAKWKETQFDTESRLQTEPNPVSEIHFTPGTPFFARLSATILF